MRLAVAGRLPTLALVVSIAVLPGCARRDVPGAARLDAAAARNTPAGAEQDHDAGSPVGSARLRSPDASAGAGDAGAPDDAGPPAVTHGPAAGEVTHDAAVIWARCARAGTLVVERDGGPGGEVPVDGTTDRTGVVPLAGLPPGETIAYRVHCRAGRADGPSRAGRFRTAPAPETPAAVRIAWGADLGGQNVCRDVDRGWPVFQTIAAADPDLFVALGDMIYADDACLPTGRYGNRQIPGPPPADDLRGFRAHWRYLHDDPGFRAMLATTAYAGTWDDHELGDDFGAGHPLLPAARRALLEWTPLRPPPEEPGRLYRRIRRGRHLDVFLLDTRQYRDADRAPDLAARPKTMLGAAQREWLRRELAASDATWKVVVSSVPLAIPTGTPEARDSWAGTGGTTGFARERAAIVAWPAARHTVWLTADVHFATLLEHRPMPGVQLHEAVAAPLGAGLFPRFDDLAPGFGSRHVEPVYGPRRPPTSLDEALPYFTVGLLDVDAAGRLSIELRDANGRTVWRRLLARHPLPATGG